MKKILLPILFIIISVASYAQCTTPLAPANLTMYSTDTQLSIYFDSTNTANTYLGIISTNPTLSSGPINGTQYNIGDNIGGGTVIFYGANYLFKATGLLANTTYYVTIYSAKTGCVGEPMYSTSTLSGNNTTFNGTPGIPAGYYSTATGSCSILKTQLFNIIKPTSGNPPPTYTPGMWSTIYITDDRLNDAGTKTILWDQYTDKPSTTGECEFTFGSPYQDKGTSGGSECQRYNREHTFPQAWFGGSVEPMFSDILLVYPSDKKVNSLRGNFPYGETTSPTATTSNGTKIGPNTFSPLYTSTIFEPINEYKGDLARATLYVVTAYEDQVATWQGNSNANDVLDGTTYPALDDWYLKLLFKWHQQDPVSQKEIDRNNDVYMIQGNRNPYIDHPEYVYIVWQCTNLLPVTIISFDAVKVNNSILLKWNATHEANFKKYEIERSTDGINYRKIGEAPSANLGNYSFIDNDLPLKNTVYYRLKMIDIDGASRFSKIVAERLNNNFNNAIVYPNPSFGALTIKLEIPLTLISKLIVADVTGRIVLSKDVASGTNNISLDVNNLAAGRYLIHLTNSSEVIDESFVIIK